MHLNRFSVLREQWIRAKYQRLEFVDVDKQTYLQGHKEDYLWKRGKEDKKFQQRKFVLDEKANTLKYYNKEDVCIISFHCGKITAWLYDMSDNVLK